MKKNTSKNKSNIWFIGVIIALIGALLLLWGSYYDSQPLIKNIKNASQTFGCSIIIAGIIGVVLEWRKTKEYFGERLKEIIIDDSYLSGLDSKKLNNLFLSIQEHIFKTDDIKKEDGFLEYFNTNLHKYIVKPYRENVSSEIIFKIKDNHSLEATDKVSYICRSMNNKLQEDIQILPNEEEFLSWDSVKIKIGNSSSAEFNADDLKALLSEQKPLKVKIDTEKYKDKVKVEISQKYTIRTCKLQSWQMSNPTKNLRISISYPKSLQIDVLPLLELDKFAVETDEPGYFGLIYNEWMLPKSGITWTFIGCKDQREQVANV